MHREIRAFLFYKFMMRNLLHLLCGVPFKSRANNLINFNFQSSLSVSIHGECRNYSFGFNRDQEVLESSDGEHGPSYARLGLVYWSLLVTAQNICNRI